MIDLSKCDCGRPLPVDDDLDAGDEYECECGQAWIWETVAVIPAGTTSLQLRVNCGRRGSAPNVNGTFSIAQMALTKE